MLKWFKSIFKDGARVLRTLALLLPSKRAGGACEGVFR